MAYHVARTPETSRKIMSASGNGFSLCHHQYLLNVKWLPFFFFFGCCSGKSVGILPLEISEISLWCVRFCKQNYQLLSLSYGFGGEILIGINPLSVLQCLGTSMFRRLLSSWGSGSTSTSLCSCYEGYCHMSTGVFMLWHACIYYTYLVYTSINASPLGFFECFI